MSKRDGLSLSGWLHFWPAYFLVRVLIYLIFLGLLLLLPAYSEELKTSEPDWPELLKALDEIDSGLQMTEQPLSEIDSSQQQREKLLNETRQSLNNRKKSLDERENLLDERELALNEREKGLDQREILYDGMQKDLDSLEKTLKRTRIIGYVVIAVVTAAAGYGGYKLGKAIR